jgi:hypothetical protein
MRHTYYKCSNPVYHINLLNNNIYKKYNINISTYIPLIIKKIVNSIHNKYNNQYIICPFYSNLYNYQIGITETGKCGETDYDTIIRGINEECGLSNIVWTSDNTYIHKQKTKNWFGVCVNNCNYKYNPQLIKNKCPDDLTNKVAIIIHNQIHQLLNVYNNIKKGDIHTDDITGLGLISVYDCKKIVNKINN